MSYPKRSDHALPRMATAALLFFSFSVTRGEAAPEPGLCSGLLTKSEGEFVIAEEPEHVCIFNGEAKRKIFAVCAEGHYCEVEGILDDCKDSGECSEITSVVSVRDLTLGKKQEQPPLPDVPPSGNQKDAVPLPNIPPTSTPAEFAKLPAEIRSQTEGIVRECHSPVQVLGGFSDEIATNDYRFVLLHFEKIRCDDVTAICKTAGCLHQIYASKDNQPYQLAVSINISEIELKLLDGTIGIEVTSREGTRLRRWNGAAFQGSSRD